MNDTVQSNNEFLNAELQSIMYSLSSAYSPLFDMAFPIIKVHNNLTTEEEKELLKKLDDSLNEVTIKIKKQLRQFKKAGDKLNNLDLRLSEKEFALGLGELVISEETNKLLDNLTQTIEEKKESSKETFDNLISDSEYSIYDITYYLGASAPLYISYHNDTKEYVVYVKPEDIENSSAVIEELKTLVVKLINDNAGNYKLIVSKPVNDISNISEYEVKDDYVEVVLPSSFSNLVNLADTLGLDPFSFLNDDNMVCKGDK